MNQLTSDMNLTSVMNFRDIGGVITSRNGTVKEGIVFRSANPDKISSEDVKKLHSLKIRTIIDLRAPHEVSRKTIKIADTTRISLPLDFQKTTRERLLPVLRKKNPEAAITEISQSLYIEILDASASVLREVIELLLLPDRSPVIIHCYAGKDRTGIISALLLLALGAGRDHIIADFMKSNDALISFFKRDIMRKKILSFGFFPAEAVLFAVTVRQNNIESVIDRVSGHYGGIEGYLASAGFDISRLDDLRERLCIN